MEDKVIKLEKQLDELEKSNISLYINDVKKIKKNAIKLENEINKILMHNENISEDENQDDNSECENSRLDIDIDINIDNELIKYSKLINHLNESEINEKTIEELNKIYEEIIKIEKNIRLFQTLNCELNIKNV